MERKKFDESFYEKVKLHFSNDPNKIKKLFLDAFEVKLIKKDFAPYLHTLISGTCMIKDYWQDIFTVVKRAVKEDGAFNGGPDYDEFLDKLILGMLFLYADKANLLDAVELKESPAKEYDDAEVIDDVMEELKEEACELKEEECSCMGARTEENGRDRTGLGYTVNEAPVNSWDEYFYNVAVQAARNSKCFSRRIGAILVKDNTIISTGYNGPPRGIPTCDKRWKLDSDFLTKYGNLPDGTEVAGKCPRYVLGAKSGEMMHLCVAGHAEENAILNCARLGIETKGTIMYMTCGMPCSKCWVKIINAGIKEIVVMSYAIYDESTRFLMDNADVKVRLFDFLI